jgi:AraC-like DNA-binding protein
MCGRRAVRSVIRLPVLETPSAAVTIDAPSLAGGCMDDFAAIAVDGSSSARFELCTRPVMETTGERTEVRILSDAELWSDLRVRSTRATLGDDHRITLTVAGYARVRHGRRTFDVRPGSVTIMSPGELYLTKPQGAEPWSAISLHVRGLTLRTAGGRESDVASRPALFALETRAVREALESLELDLSAAALAERLQAVFDAVDARLPAAPRERAPLRHVHAERALAQFRQHAVEPITLDAVAEAVGASKWSLCKTFKDHVGVSPLYYQRLLRVAEARACMATGGSIADATYDCGFFDQSHLHRWFRRVLGVTPGQYVRSLRAPQ